MTHMEVAESAAYNPVRVCDQCGGKVKIVAALTDPGSIRRYLEGVGLPARAPPMAPSHTTVSGTRVRHRLPSLRDLKPPAPHSWRQANPGLRAIVCPLTPALAPPPRDSGAHRCATAHTRPGRCLDTLSTTRSILTNRCLPRRSESRHSDDM